ncbi:cell number regulator 7-like protein [Tanacetum coccineum]
MNMSHHRQQSKWSSGLCDCGNNAGTCFITCCLPCVTFGQIAEVLDEGRSSCALCQEHTELKHRGLDPSKGWIGPPNAPPHMPPSMQR